jgi:hypothetical protein
MRRTDERHFPRISPSNQILESAAEIGEIGAAVHLAPNAYRVIKNLGGDLLQYGSVPCKAYRCCRWRFSPFTHNPCQHPLICLSPPLNRSVTFSIIQGPLKPKS